MPALTDQLGNEVNLPSIPTRIISLVPSQTELLHHLGLHREVLAITKFCVHPASWHRTKERIGGTKNIHIDRILEMEPDLVLASKEENIREQVESLGAKVPIYTSDVKDLPSALQMITDVSTIVGKEEEGAKLVKGIELEFSTLPFYHQYEPAAYLIWNDPMMSIGGDSFINAMMHEAGFKNVFANTNRYPEITLEDLRNSSCKYLFLSTEPFPFNNDHLQYFQENLPGVQVMLVDGEMFSWYGSRMLKAPAYFMELRKSIAALA